MTATMPRRRVLVGSTTGRGPCASCGLVAELHEVLEEVLVENPFGWAWRPERLADLCLPCSFDALLDRARPQLAPAA